MFVSSNFAKTIINYAKFKKTANIINSDEYSKKIDELKNGDLINKFEKERINLNDENLESLIIDEKYLRR